MRNPIVKVEVTTPIIDFIETAQKFPAKFWLKLSKDRTTTDAEKHIFLIAYHFALMQEQGLNTPGAKAMAEVANFLN